MNYQKEDQQKRAKQFKEEKINHLYNSKGVAVGLG